MTKFILIRHGQSTANVDLKFAGQTNPELTEKGVLQAEKLCEWVLSNYKIDKIYASDLSRAYNTAKPIAEKSKLSIVENKEFREIYAGKWQGKSYDSIKEDFFDDFFVWLNDIGKARCTDGEYVKELADRVYNEIKRLAELENGKTVLISTHATPIRAFQTICTKGDIAFAKDVQWTANASVSVCTYDKGEFKFELLGYNEYLKDLKSEFPNAVV